MKIQFTSTTSAGIQYKFLSDLNAVIEACTSIAGALQQQIDNKISADEALESIETNALVRNFSAQLLPTFGSGILSTHCMQWVRMAMATFDERYDQLNTNCELCMLVTTKDAKSIIQDMEYIAGCLSFALLSSLGVLKLNNEELQETPVMSEGVQAFIQDKYRGTKPHLRFLLTLFKYYNNGHPFARVSDQFPDSWEQFCDLMEGLEFGQEVLSYGDALYICDVKAILLEKAEVDETLIATLTKRMDEQISARQLFPHKLSLFLDSIPNNFCDFMLLYEDRLSESLIDMVLSNHTPFDEKYVELVSKAPLLKSVYENEFAAHANAASYIAELLGSDLTQEF